jgi:alkylhydroperoxidase/carboxymuconolactone decarboxylase family protein YurZ
MAIKIEEYIREDESNLYHQWFCGLNAQAAAKAGASRQEMTQTLGMAIYMGAGPSVMYASHALAAFDQFAGGG